LLDSELIDRIKNNKLKLIGWGTGGAFVHLNSVAKLDLAYSVDKSVKAPYVHENGILIQHADALKSEDPEKVVVLIYSSFIGDIAPQIKEYGDFNYISASVFIGYQKLEEVINHLEEASATVIEKVSENPQPAILIQGPIVANLTSLVVKYYAAIYPEAYILVSTWNDTPSDLLADIEKFADQILLNEKPFKPGRQNRNMLITSTYNGLRELKKKGITFVLKTRADMVVKNKAIFTEGIELLNQYPLDYSLQTQMKYRIIFPETYTRKYLLFHPSDMNMFGHIDDLLLYWNVPLEDSEYDCSIEKIKVDRTLIEYVQDRSNTEIYICYYFKSKLENGYENTLEGSWKLFKDAFIVTDDDWFDLFWFKHVMIPQFRNNHEPVANFNREFWEKIYNGLIEKTDTRDLNLAY